MNLPLNWLKEFVDIKDSPQNIAEKLTLSGSEVEKIVTNHSGLSKVIVGKIIKIKKHPNASKLQLAYVDVGRKKDLQIVCGAPNIKTGQKVPTVLVGGSVPEFTVEAREIRDVVSHGMLASPKELGISDDHAGILILPKSAKLGADVIKLLELDEVILDLDITPNRPDCFSIRGLAREVAALYGKKSKEVSYHVKESKTPASSAVSVKIEEKKLCQKYCARVIQGIYVKESPLWLRNRMAQIGIRSINNVVDVTNYVMYELGHPLHAFDANLVDENSIMVRKAKKNEKLAALDEETYALQSDMLVIADEKKAVAIAGVMGGQETGVTEGTHNIILEAAIFNSVSIRKTSKALALRSESSSRFEKGIDAEMVEVALNRAASLINELAGGTVLKGIVSSGHPKQVEKRVKLQISEVSRILGTKVDIGKIKSILQFLGFGINGSKSQLNVKIPSWRVHDVHEPIDLVEEIGRIIDYNTIPKTLPETELVSPQLKPLHGLRHKLRHYLAGIGYSEILTYSFYDESSIKLSAHPKSEHIKLTNPVNEEYPYLRASLGPWMLQKLSQNSSLLARESFGLFEIGKVFRKSKGESWKGAIGLINTKLSDEGLFRTLRGVIESFAPTRVVIEKDRGTYRVLAAKRVIGFVTVYPKGSVSGLRFRSSCAIAFLDLDTLFGTFAKEKALYKTIPLYPVVERDLGVVAPNVVHYKDLEKAVSSFNKLITSVELFDVYHGLGKDVSLALRITFLSKERTLESTEVDEIMERLQHHLKNKYKVSFR